MQGDCDVKTGRCHCHTGFGGSACQQSTLLAANSPHSRCIHFTHQRTAGISVIQVHAVVIATTNTYPAFLCAVSCPGTNGTVVCSGHGRCLTMKEGANLNNVEYTAWDGDQIRGCLCDDGFQGFDCSEKQCPLGDDPGTTGIQEIQVIHTQVDCQQDIQTIELTGTDTNEVSYLQTRLPCC